MHNMIIEDEHDLDTPDEEQTDIPTPEVEVTSDDDARFQAFLARHRKIKNKEAHTLDNYFKPEVQPIIHSPMRAWQFKLERKTSTSLCVYDFTTMEMPRTTVEPKPNKCLLDRRNNARETNEKDRC